MKAVEQYFEHIKGKTVSKLNKNGFKLIEPNINTGYRLFWSLIYFFMHVII